MTGLYLPHELAPTLPLRHTRFAEVQPGAYGAILLDLDDTLYRYDPCHSAGLAAAFSVDPLGLDWPMFASRYRTCRDVVTQRLESQGACRSRLLAFQMMCEAAHVPLPFARALSLDEAYWDAFIVAMVPHGPALDFLELCAQAEVPVCLLSDMTAHVQIRKIARLGIGDLVAHLVTSEEIGAEKPDPRMFDEALRKLRVGAEQALMLGDSLDKDIHGALACGIAAGLIDLAREGA